MPHLKTVYFKPRQDSDHYSYSKVGVTSISDIVVLAEALKKRGAKIPESLEKYFDGSVPDTERPSEEERQEIYTFEFEGLKSTQIDKFFKAKMQREEDLNTLLLPYYIPQDLYADLHKLAQLACDMTVRFPVALRNTYGAELMKMTIEMLRDINATCNGFGNETSFARTLNLVLYRSAEMQEIIRVLLDTKYISYGACQNILKLTLKVQQDAKEELAKIARKDDPIVAAIKVAKNFPKLKGVDLDDMFDKENKDHEGFIETRMPIR